MRGELGVRGLCQWPVAAFRRMGERENSDETYVIDLCDEVLGEQSLR
jgi:hypothetical protein